jgi:hypothetical protein
MIATLFTTGLLVFAAVLIHLEALRRLSDLLPKLPTNPRLSVGVLGAILAHLLEIVVFSLGIYLLDTSPNHGKLVGAVEGGQYDYFYYSMVSYTSLGFGDIRPTGSLRLLTGMETLTGLVLIAWTASFMYVQMQRFWIDSNDDHTSKK